MFTTVFNALYKNKPLIHHITNYVTTTQCANMTIACGGSPLMADEESEIEEIVSLANALVINIGTINKLKASSMIKACVKAQSRNIPIVLDPVGIGASKFRLDTISNLLNNCTFTVIKGNISEIKTLALNTTSGLGVDASIDDEIDETNIDETIAWLKNFSKRIGSIIVVTGKIDLVVNPLKSYIIKNGHPMMSDITGSGCMLASLIATVIAQTETDIIDAVATALIMMGIAGEEAYKSVNELNRGNASYSNFIIDEIYKMNLDTLKRGAKYELRI